MQVTETLTEGLKREFKIIIPAATMQQRVQGKLTEIGEQVRLPGFRPGKVPMQVLKQRYQKSVLGEVLQEAVQTESQRVVEERKLRPAGQPKVEITAFEDDKDLEFTVALELVPDIEVMDFKSITLEKDVVDVPEKEIDEVLNNIAKQMRRSEPAKDDHKAAKGDITVIDFVGTVDGVEFPGGSSNGFYLELGSGSFIPGFEDQLVGAKKGDKIDVSVTFPEDYANKDLAGKPAKFAVTIQEIRVPQDTKIDEEAAKSMGFESVEALTKSAREQVEGEYSQAARARLKRKLLDILAEKHDFTLPPGLVEMEFSSIWRQIEEDKKANRLDAEDQGKSDEELQTEYRAIAERRVKLGLLLSEVGRANNIQVSQDDLTKAVIEEARKYRGQERQVFEFFQKNPQAVQQMSAPIFEDKVIDFILDLAKVKERKVLPEQFKKEGEAA